MKITYKFVIVRWLLKSVEKYTQGYLKSTTMLKVMCRCVYVTGFWKTDQDVTHEINRIKKFKHL